MFVIVVKQHRLPTLCPAADLQFASARDYKHRTASIALSLIIHITVTNLSRKYIEIITNKLLCTVQHAVQVRTTNYVELIGLTTQTVGLTEGQGRVCLWTRGQAWPDRFSAKVWRGTAAVGSERRSPVRVAEDDSPFVPSLSPNQFSLASPK